MKRLRLVTIILLAVGAAAEANVGTYTWAPHSPFSPKQLARLCNDPENTWFARPPDPAGFCDAEVRLVSTQFKTGQGISEGRGEISFSGTATPLDDPSATTPVSGSTATYDVGQTEHQGLDLGTYRVPLNTTRYVDVCLTFTEHDDGANGQDDIAFGCTQVALHCSGHDYNGDGAADGLSATSATLGPLTFCGPDVCHGSMVASIGVTAADADMDNVPNDQDFTPDLCSELDKGQAGNAALVYYEFADDGMRGFFQALGIDIAQVYGQYDYVVLVADNDSSNPLDVNHRMFAEADEVYPPTRDGLRAAMRDLTAKGYRFDTFVFAHGFKMEKTDTDSSFEVMSGEKITGGWLEFTTNPDRAGTARGGVPIVAWWSTTCIAARQIDSWIAIGAVAASGPASVQFFPNAWGPFFASWISGQSYQSSVDDSLTATVIAAADFEIANEGQAEPWVCVIDDPMTPIADDGPGLATEKNACAEDFFNDSLGPNPAKYNIEDVYDPLLSGAENMQVASMRYFVGQTNVTFGAASHTWP